MKIKYEKEADGDSSRAVKCENVTITSMTARYLMQALSSAES